MIYKLLSQNLDFYMKNISEVLYLLKLVFSLFYKIFIVICNIFIYFLLKFILNTNIILKIFLINKIKKLRPILLLPFLFLIRNKTFMPNFC